MVNTYEFKAAKNAALFVEQALNLDVDSVLIQTMRPIPQGVYYAVHVTANSDGITQLNGCVEPLTTSTPRHSKEGFRETGKQGFFCHH